MGWGARGFFGCLMKKESPSTSPRFAVGTTEQHLTLDVPELTVGDLNEVTRSFSAANLVGRASRNNGTVVYRATLPNGTAAAAKVLGRPGNRDWAWGASEDAFLRQQVSLLSTLRHDNLVRLLGYTISPDLRVLLFEFATVGTLHDVLHGPRGEAQPGSSNRPGPLTLTWAQRTKIALDVAMGLQYLHEAAEVSHYGVSSTNVLLFEGLRAKIADYDLFEQLPPPDVQYAMVGIPIGGYLAPEIAMTGRRVAYKTDVYSFGVVLLELLTGRKSVDPTLHPTRLVSWAIPLVANGGVKQWIDPNLGTQYPGARALKLARIAQQCLHDLPRFRPSMGVVAQMISDIVRD